MRYAHTNIAAKEVKGVGLLKFLYFRDPEGNMVEIQSWLKLQVNSIGLLIRTELCYFLK